MTTMPPLSDPMYPMSTQAVIDRVYEHFVVQGHPRCTANGFCLYKDGTGNGCTIGCCFPVNTPREIQKHKGLIRDIARSYPWFVSAVFASRLEELIIIQRIHDSLPADNEPETFREMIESRLKRTSKNLGCVFPGDK